MMPPFLENSVGEIVFSLGKEAFWRFINQFYFEMTSDVLQNSIICAFESKQCTEIMSSVKKKKKTTKENKTKQNNYHFCNSKKFDMHFFWKCSKFIGYNTTNLKP